MHKQIVTIVLALVITSVLSAQESTDKTITIGTDILPLAGGFANGHFGLTHNNGKNEIFIAAFAGQQENENISFLGIFPSYRLYPSGKGKGFFLREDSVLVSSIGIMSRKKCLQSHFGQLLI